MMDGRILPEPFQVAYEMLWARSLGDGGPGAGVGSHPLDGSAGAVGVAGKGGPGGKVENAGWRLSSGQAEKAVGRNAGPQKKSVGKTSRTMRDERAFELKKKVDRQLRRIAAQIRAFEDGRKIESAGQRVCTGRCKRFGDGEWTYCAHCGGPMREKTDDE